jgi:hypothetical protein
MEISSGLLLSHIKNDFPKFVLTAIAQMDDEDSHVASELRWDADLFMQWLERVTKAIAVDRDVDTDQIIEPDVSIINAVFIEM